MNSEVWLAPEDASVCVIGLGYVGLPLAVEFGKLFPTIGFDLDPSRVLALSEGKDHTGEVTEDQIEQAKDLMFTSSIDEAAGCNFYVVAVPTPIDGSNNPDMSLLTSASTLVGSVLKLGDVVVYESTVYPGATEQVCVPALESESGLICNKDFFVGYSPERINPGDSSHNLVNIVKVTSGSTPEVAEYVDNMYSRIVSAGTFKASSIAVAEAAKVIENTQRDLNIALMNELAIIFDLMGIDTHSVLEAAATKWNFHDYNPGLVGGHCIGVDPYYLTHKAEALGYRPKVILAGREINDSMARYTATRIVTLLRDKVGSVVQPHVLVLGYAFKENCTDIRNTKVRDLVAVLMESGVSVDVFDPLVDANSAREQLGFSLVEHVEPEEYEAVVMAVAHSEFVSLTPGWFREHSNGNPQVFFDIKGIWPIDEVTARL